MPGTAATIPFLRNKFLRYAEARPLLHQADLLLWLDVGSEFGRMVRRYAPPSAPYVHVGMTVVADYHGGPIHSVDIQFLRGGQRRRLSEDVARHPGKIEVWRVLPPFHPDGADQVAAEMEWIIDRPYGWRTCVAYALRTTRWWPFMAPLPDERLQRHIKPICSQAVAIACRRAGRDPLPATERVTLPWHFAQHGFAEYRFTLIP